MKKKSAIFILIGVVILIAVFYYVGRKDQEEAPVTNNSPAQSVQNIQPESKIIKVNYSSSTAFQPQTERIEQGQEVSLRVISDIADEVHLHGYDLNTDLESNKEGQLNFKADKTGRFEFELEDHKTLLGVIEVYPK